MKIRGIFAFAALATLVTVATAADMNLVLLKEAVSSGAQCLDGSAPAYYFRKGQGVNATKFLVHFEGGGWCYNEDECVARSKTALGSSTSYAATMTAGGLFSDNPAINPDFFSFSMAFIKYCDGASFSGNVDQPIHWKGDTLYYRGHRVFKAVYQDLLDNAGLSAATEVIATGCSAGGLSTYLHLDEIRQILPASTRLVGFPDAGFFLDLTTWDGKQLIRPEYQNVARMQNVSYGVNSDCVKGVAPGDVWKCFMAPYTLPFIKTPLFVMNSEYDSWQMINVLNLPSACFHNISVCTQPQLTAFQNFRNTMLRFLQPVSISSADGIWADACLTHCQTFDTKGFTQIKIKGVTLQQAFGNWYFKRGSSKFIDSAYPSNPTC